MPLSTSSVPPKSLLIVFGMYTFKDTGFARIPLSLAGLTLIIGHVELTLD
jgi:hypothetical protein